MSCAAEGGAEQANGLSCAAEGGAQHANALIYAAGGCAERINGVSSSTEGCSRLANRFYFTTEGSAEDNAGQANGVNSPCEAAAGQVLRYPTQEEGSICYPIQETGEEDARQMGQPNRQECYQQIGNGNLYAVSLTNPNEQAIQHNCSVQEIKLWNQQLKRQVS